MGIGPGLPLSLLVGLFHAALRIYLSGAVSGRLPLLWGAAALGAWAGDALGGRIGLEIGSLGDYRLIAASIGAWVGIGLVELIAVAGPAPAPRVPRLPRPGGIRRFRQRGRG